MTNIEHFNKRRYQLMKKKSLTQDDAVELSKINNLLVVLNAVGDLEEIGKGNYSKMRQIGGIDAFKKIIESAKTSNEIIDEMFKYENDDQTFTLIFDEGMKVAKEKIKKEKNNNKS